MCWVPKDSLALPRLPPLPQQGDVGMKGPLVDNEGFPRADIDVYAVRVARNKTISECACMCLCSEPALNTSATTSPVSALPHTFTRHATHPIGSTGLLVVQQRSR